LLGSYSGRTDEGMANVSYYLYDSLKQLANIRVSLVNLNSIWSIGFWRKISVLRPHVLHYIPGPTVKGLILAKFLQKLTRSKLVVSATKPVLPESFKKLAGLLSPDLTIVQSDGSEKLFNNLGYKTAFMPNGVDTKRFAPVDLQQKKKLRDKYGLNENDFIVLHIGPIKRGRNQQALLQLKNGEKILLISSVTNPSEKEADKDLISDNPNVLIWRTYFRNIEEIYKLADVYIFPVFEKLNSIDIPLSVLEAMSCNLPVVTSRYGGLERILQVGDGLSYIQNEDEIRKIVSELKENGIVGGIHTREKVLKFSWNNVSNDLASVYVSLIPDPTLKK
jgi:glycosyltransferase involved in cell wall biosynthesis